MNTFVVFFADQDQIAVEADSFEYNQEYVTFNRHGDQVAVFYADKVKGVVQADALAEEDEEEEEHDDQDAF